MLYEVITIPSYRLPRHVLKTETETLTALGGRFLFNQVMGRDFTTDELFADGYLAVFLGLGCQEPVLLGVEGEDPAAPGYDSGIGFMLRITSYNVCYTKLLRVLRPRSTAASVR